MSGRISTRELPRRFDCEYTDLNIQYTNNMYNMFQYAISNLELFFSSSAIIRSTCEMKCRYWNSAPPRNPIFPSA